MKLRIALLAATILTAPVAVQAQVAPAGTAYPTGTAYPAGTVYQAAPGYQTYGGYNPARLDGWYINAAIGANYLQPVNLNGVGAVNLNNGNNFNITGYNAVNNGAKRPQAITDWGFVGLVAAGYGFGNGLRAELEGDYRNNKIHKISGNFFSPNYSGNAQSYGPMVNLVYDFDLASSGITYMFPYIGAGVGAAGTSAQNLSLNQSYFYNGPQPPRDGQYARNVHGGNGAQWGVAYQAILGVGFPIDSVPGLTITAEYRFYGVQANQRFSVSGTTYTPAGTTPYSSTVKLGAFFNHSGLLGVRYAFNAAPPPAPAPVVAPAAALARSYLVFFDWDRADLTTRARQIIAEAAANAQKVQYTRIEVNGYTDTSGSPAYNQKLSVRRAQNVAAELVKDGVPRNSIDIKGFGETNLLVPTADNVREPQNRRVEIIIH